MTCRECVEFLMEYEAGTLAEDARRIFDQHLDACGNCKVFVTQYRTVIVAGKSAFAVAGADPLPDLPEELVQRILEAIRRD